MKSFNFEKNLPHQSRAVESVAKVLEGLPIVRAEGAHRECINPRIDLSDTRYGRNVTTVREENTVHEGKGTYRTNVLDVMMETGTGKTYTYAKTMLELNKRYGLFKFVVVVPTLPIKAGTIDFLLSEGAREHFKEEYGKTIALHVVESQKKSGKKSYIPPAVKSFASAGDYERGKIQVLVINAGMINSDTMQKVFDSSLFDAYPTAFSAIAAVHPVVIIDEPHKFGKANKTWENIQKMRPQFVVRYGATFDGEYENLLYELTAVDAFNDNLVKGVVGHITEFDEGKDALVRLVSTDGTEAHFELIEGKAKRSAQLGKKESLERLHPAMAGLAVESLNKSEVVLSNGLSLKKGDKLNPYSYAETLQESMIKKAVRHHFELERELLTRSVRIKPLTLFFIDNIEEYRDANGYLRRTVESAIAAEIQARLKVETHAWYRTHLEAAQHNISKTHGGYFSQDNSEKDEAIEAEVREILHDKQAMLAIDNPRRFIFSKWTLREGWDNPNVFQICKLRSSGSDTSKLQEVGRGLRLPVNEYNNRVKDQQFYLNYFVDFTESDFVKQLRDEINEKSGALSPDDTPEKLSDDMKKRICATHGITERELIKTLMASGAIDEVHEFLPGGFAVLRELYPKAFVGVGVGKIRTAHEHRRTIQVRVSKYPALKELWEELSRKAVLEYRIADERAFEQIFTGFLTAIAEKLPKSRATEKTHTIAVRDGYAEIDEHILLAEGDLITARTMGYSIFLRALSAATHVRIDTLHRSFVAAGVDINAHLNPSTVRLLADKFNTYLLHVSFGSFQVGYQTVQSTVHPTRLTDENGDVLKEVDASSIGVKYAQDAVAKSYLLEELFYDSELEKEDIRKDIEGVTVFTKIPKNAIRIPVAGGRSYSPDFAYVLEHKDGGKKLYLVVETKNTEEEDLKEEEKKKIQHAESFFGDTRIVFRKQMTERKMEDLIREVFAH